MVVLDQAAARIGTSFQGQPELAAAVRVTIGGVRRELGRYESSEENLTAALETRRRLPSDRHDDVAEALVELGYLLYRNKDYDRSERNTIRRSRLRVKR